MSHTRKHAKRLIGYGRISTEAQDLTRQRQALKAYGCKVIFEDRASGKSLAGRPELTHALDELRSGDCLVLAAWDRATRSMWDGLHIVKHVLDAGAAIKVLDFPSLDLATPRRSRFPRYVLGNGRARADKDHRTHEGRSSHRHAQRCEDGTAVQVNRAPAQFSGKAVAFSLALPMLTAQRRRTSPMAQDTAPGRLCRDLGAGDGPSSPEALQRSPA